MDMVCLCVCVCVSVECFETWQVLALVAWRATPSLPRTVRARVRSARAQSWAWVSAMRRTLRRRRRHSFLLTGTTSSVLLSTSNRVVVLCWGEFDRWAEEGNQNIGWGLGFGVCLGFRVWLLRRLRGVHSNSSLTVALVPSDSDPFPMAAPSHAGMLTCPICNTFQAKTELEIASHAERCRPRNKPETLDAAQLAAPATTRETTTHAKRKTSSTPAKPRDPLGDVSEQCCVCRCIDAPA